MSERDIKFRAFYKGKMVDGVQPSLNSTTPTVCLVPDDMLIHEPTGTKRFYYEVQTDDIMQFTGLKDKNGKEVYEGDIVCWIEPSEMAQDYVHRSIVRFIDGGFQPFTICWKPDALFDSHETGINLIDVSRRWNWSDHFKFEVVGNIYENPELLESEQSTIKKGSPHP